MLRIISIFGLRLRKLSIYSQASVTKYLLCPTFTLPPISARLPPTRMVGSSFALSKIKETIEVVVVLPWVPDMAILFSYSSIRTPSICALVTVSMPLSAALTISGLSFPTAAEYTTKSALSTFSALWPINILAPLPASFEVISDSFISEPETLYPLDSKISAMADSPMPPMPMQCIFLY